MMPRDRFPMPPEECPVCGDSIPVDALACPSCGADEETGWETDAVAGDGLDLPTEDFDYDAFVEGEFSGGGRVKPPGVAWGWWLLALLVVAGLILAPVLVWF
jgi:hypothetical protein